MSELKDWNSRDEYKVAKRVRVRGNAESTRGSNVYRNGGGPKLVRRYQIDMLIARRSLERKEGDGEKDAALS